MTASHDPTTGPVPHGGPSASADAEAAPPPTGHPSDEELTIEEEVAEAEAVIDADIASIAAERDEYRSLAQRIQADFENYKKRIIKQQTEHLERAAEALVEKLLPVLDTADLALDHDEGNESLRQVIGALVDVLGKEGVERIDPQGQPFDPTEHDAVMHEPGDGGEPEVIEVLRAGYRYKGRVIRPAMVKVKG